MRFSAPLLVCASVAWFTGSAIEPKAGQMAGSLLNSPHAGATRVGLDSLVLIPEPASPLLMDEPSLLLAEQLLELPAEDRLRQAWLLILGREPKGSEIKRAARFIVTTADAFSTQVMPTQSLPALLLHGQPQAVLPKDARTAAWASLAQILRSSAGHMPSH